MKSEAYIEIEKKLANALRDAYDLGFIDGCAQERESIIDDKKTIEKKNDLLKPVDGLTNDDIKEAYL